MKLNVLCLSSVTLLILNSWVRSADVNSDDNRNSSLLEISLKVEKSVTNNGEGVDEDQVSYLVAFDDSASSSDEVTRENGINLADVKAESKIPPADELSRSIVSNDGEAECGSSSIRSKVEDNLSPEKIDDAFQRLVQKSADFFAQNFNSCDNKNFKSGGNFVRMYERYSKGDSSNIANLTSEAFKKQVLEDAASVRIILTTETLNLAREFLAVKMIHGCEAEKLVYNEMSPEDFILRLISKRPVAFAKDSGEAHMLRGGRGKLSFGYPLSMKMEDQNMGPGKLVFSEYISYDEIAVSAMISVSSSSFIFNDCGLLNMSEFKLDSSHEERGVVIGSVGARFEESGVMEYAQMLVTKNQNTAKDGYGPYDEAKNAGASAETLAMRRLWSQHYGVDHLPTYDEVLRDSKAPESSGFAKRYSIFKESKDEYSFFNVEFYKKRMLATVVPFLMDANLRGKEAGKEVHVRVMGTGLGVWLPNYDEAGPVVTQALYEVYAEAIQSLPKDRSIRVVEFNSFPIEYDDHVFSSAESSGITIKSTHYTRGENQASRLPDSDGPARLLVMQYAWDGGSFPGNEYWMGYLDSSMDPAIASCSTVADLQNSVINEDNFTLKAIKVYQQNPKLDRGA
jgi:hypothetical protein